MLNMKPLKGVKNDEGKPEARFFYHKEFSQLKTGNKDLMAIAEYVENVGQGFRSKITPVLELTILHDRLLKYYLDSNNIDDFIRDISKVSKLGVKKYGMYNYRAGLPISRVYDALCRHFLKIMLDTDGIDPESGVHHIIHMFANIYILWANLRNNDLSEVSDEPK